MLDLEPIRKNRDAFRDAYAFILRCAEPDSDKAAQYPAAQRAMYVAAMESASDVPALIAEIDRLTADVNLRTGQLIAARRHADEYRAERDAMASAAAQAARAEQ